MKVLKYQGSNMKYFLIKEEHYEGSKFIYKKLNEVTCYTRSKEIMIYDEKLKNIWYSFLF